VNEPPGATGRRKGRPRKHHASVQAALAAIARAADTARRLEQGSSDAVLRSVVDATVALFEAEAASIALYEPSADRLVFRVAAGAQGEAVIGLAIPPGEGVVGYVYTTGQALALSDVGNDARFGRTFAERTRYVPRSIVAVPLIDEQGTIGVLEVLDKRDAAKFSLRDVELASIFARQATVAIRVSRVERDTGELLRTVVAALGGGDIPNDAIEALVSETLSALDRDDDTRLWLLVDAVARVRRADPAQLTLVTDILGVLATHAAAPGPERARPSRTGAGPPRTA
jgi:GAF domain-containing protein